jgi:H/ACA ribonucleoprotein complex subunit 3
MTLLKCPKCGSYTMGNVCGKCGVDTVSPHPARYSPLDKYGRYRRQFKKQFGVQDG